MASKPSTFQEFQTLCERVSQAPAHKDKQELLRQALRPELGDLFVFVKLLLPKVDARKFHLQDKSLVRLFGKLLAVDPADMAEANESGPHAGDMAAVVQSFFAKSRVCHTHTSSLTLSEVDGVLDQLSLSGKEEEHVKVLAPLLGRLTPDDLKWLLCIVLKDLMTGAGQKQVLTGLHPDAYSWFQIKCDLAWVVRQAQHDAGTRQPSDPSPSSGAHTSDHTDQGTKAAVAKDCKDCKDAPKAKHTKPTKANKKKAAAMDVQLMTPFKPMLATACKSYAVAGKKCPSGTIFADIKYDGERIQVHKKGKAFAFFSRNLKPAAQYKVEHMEQYVPQACTADSVVLDGEILMVDNKTGTPLPFGTLGLHKREKFADASPCYFVFDILYLNGTSLLATPMERRRQILEANVQVVRNRIHLSQMQRIENKEDLEDLMVSCIDGGLEGLVLKDSQGVYEPGKRHWLKMKKDYLEAGAMADTADLVVLGGNFGSGRKGSLLSSFLMGCWDARDRRWKTVCKCSNGLDDKQLADLQTSLKMTKCGRDAPAPPWLDIKKELMPDYMIQDVETAPVWEVTGAQFSKSNKHTADGISIRFPRLTKMRDDKTWKEATDLAQLKRLVAASKLSDASLLQAMDRVADVADVADAADAADTHTEAEKKSCAPAAQRNASAQPGAAASNKLDHTTQQNTSAPPAKPDESSKKRKFAQVDAPSRKIDASKRTQTKIDRRGVSDLDSRPKCAYGSACYRKNPQHKIDEWHPGDGPHADDTADADSKPPKHVASKPASNKSEWLVDSVDDNDEIIKLDSGQKLTRPSPLPALPSVFTGLEVHLYGAMDPQAVKKIKRFFVAYDGDIGQRCSLATTHIVTAQAWDDTLASWSKQYDHVLVVGPQWALDSIDQLQCLSEDPYLVKPTV